ncbi:MAG: fibronectin type III domain-containing protein [Candidatus Moraniibacteriota bacterium]|nr:MAG: fibronectin type III domain-containing protein [Candidatus Moranbacteria bacterium]
MKQNLLAFTLSSIGLFFFLLPAHVYAAQTTGGVNWLDPLGYQKPAFYPITVPDEATVTNKYYVDMSSGSGSACSSSSPCANIDNVIGKPGTTGGPAYVYVRGTGNLSLYNDSFYGSAGNEIVIKPWGTATATFTSNSNTNSSNVHHLIFDGGSNLGIRFQSSAGQYSLHVLSNDTTIYRTQSLCSGSGALLFSVGDSKVNSNVAFINNEGYGCTSTNDQVSFVYAGPGGGGGYSNLKILNNIIRDMGGEGIEINPRVTSNNLEITGNAIHNIGKVTCSTAWNCRPGITMSVQSGGGNNGTVIKNNLIWDTGSGCVWDRGGGTPRPLIVNNTCYDYAKIGSDPWPNGIAGYSGPGTATVSNNIIYAPNGTNPLDGTYAGTNNLCGSGKSCGSSSQAWSASTFLSTNENTSNFLQIGINSTAKDTGITIASVTNDYADNTRPVGSGWDIGAYEYGTSTPDTTSPTSPTTLAANATSASSITVTWNPATDPTTEGQATSGITGYLIERCTGLSCSTFTQVGTPTSNSYSDTGLTATTLYRYRVRANDGAGNNSSYSNIVSATTPQAPPSPTFVSEYETPWNTSTSPKTTSTFNVQSGDILVAYAVNENSGSVITTPPTGTLSGTWTLKQTIAASNATYLRLWTMSVATSQTNVNVVFTNAGGNFGGDVLHFRNASSVGVTAQANSATGNPTLTLNGVSENSSIIMVNGDWSAKTGARTYNTTQAGSFTETSAYADGSSYGVEAGYYENAGTAGNKTIGISAPTGMSWSLAAVEVKGSGTPSSSFSSCSTITPATFPGSTYTGYGAPYDVFASNTPLIATECSSGDTHTLKATLGITGDTTRIVYTKGYYYDPGIADWHQFTGTCTGALNGEWCQGSITTSITDTDISTASATDPAYLVGMTCSVQGGGWKCGCRDTACSNFYWQVQGAGL